MESHKAPFLQAYVNRNERPDLLEVDKTIDIWFAEYQEKIVTREEYLQFIFGLQA